MYCSPLTCVVSALAKPKFILGSGFIYLFTVRTCISLEMKLVFLSIIYIGCLILRCIIISIIIIIGTFN